MSAAVEDANRRLLRARDAMDRAYDRPLDVRALARVALMSESHFSRSFREAFGEPPHRYLQRRRVERAMALLRETDRSVTEICFDVGLRSVGSFTTSFTRAFGRSPTAYRAAFPPAADQARVPACIVRAYGRPQHRTFREDGATGPD